VVVVILQIVLVLVVLIVVVVVILPDGTRSARQLDSLRSLDGHFPLHSIIYLATILTYRYYYYYYYYYSYSRRLRRLPDSIN